MGKQSDQDIFRHRAEQLADVAKRVIDDLDTDGVVLTERLRELDQKLRRFEEVR